MGGKKISDLTESTTVPSNSYTIIVDGTVNKKIKLETITKDLSDRVNEVNTQLNTTISNLSNRIDTQDTTINNLSNEVNTQDTTISNLSNRIDEVNEQLDKIITYPIMEHEVGVVDVKYEYGDIRRYGAVSHTDCTNAIKNCLASLGGVWSSEQNTIYFPSGVWEFSEPILIDRNNLTIKGEGIEQTILIPKNCIGITSTEKVWQDHHFGVILKDFAIDCSNGLDGMYLQYIGLNCLIENISITNANRKGIYITSSFDFPIRNVHVRGCGDYGIHIEQKKEPFEEISYITFENVSVVDCNKNNKNNPQWLIDGGNNLYLNNCKTNEGNLGIKFTGECWSCRVNNFYMDGIGDTSVCFLVDGGAVRNLTINNVYVWNMGIILKCTNGKSVIANNLDVNPSSWECKSFVIEDSFNGILYIDNKKYNYENNKERGFCSQLSILDYTDVKIISKVVDITVYNNQIEGMYEFTLPSEYEIINILATPKGNPELHNTELSKEFTPTIFTDFENGYGIVKVKLPYGNNYTTRKLKMNVVILVKINKSST